jgi:DNA-directed RNA polymerase subunit L
MLTKNIWGCFIILKVEGDSVLDIKIERTGKNRLRFIVKGEDHTLGNLIQHALMEDENIESAGFHVSHPLLKEMIFEVRFKQGIRKPINLIAKDLERFIDKLINIKNEMLTKIGD